MTKNQLESTWRFKKSKKQQSLSPIFDSDCLHLPKRLILQTLPKRLIMSNLRTVTYALKMQLSEVMSRDSVKVPLAD